MRPQHPVFEPKSGVDPELCIFSMTFFAMIREGRGGLRERRRFRGHEETANPYANLLKDLAFRQAPSRAGLQNRKGMCVEASS